MISTFRRTLDALYRGAALIAAFCLILILLIIVLQMLARWTGTQFPGSTQYAGYLMAAASFFAFASALNTGAHIRVTLLISMLAKRRFWAELWGLALGTLISSYLAWYTVKTVYWSYRLGDVSQGQDATPLWIPQMPMAIGAILLAICFLDNLVTLIFTGTDNIRKAPFEQTAAE
ncbi:TRAP transporter small permease [Chelativorans sp. YIM 93263]|uniref:TRAP transporter small permease n=1 Tax=Chelativorans sp. YIM 93263 TaxID=2906648 RepID=UPI002378F6FC|nr:TRAP transporter small permease subunit [Chelativorans sp. YIM 93263]